jgi:single-strand DNA-binding protein
VLPRIHGTGNLTSDPELAYGRNGDARATFSIACNGRRKDRDGEWQDDGSAFLRVTLWREEAELAAEALSRGLEVAFEGELIMREYETRDGGKGQSVELRYAKLGPTMNPRQQVRARKAERRDDGGSSGGGRRDEPRRDERRDQGRAGTDSRRAPADDPWASAPAPAPGGGDPWSSGPTGDYDDEPPF